MRRILITGIGGDVACSIIRCLKDSNDPDEIYGMDIKKYTPYMDVIKKAFVAPRYDDESYVPFVEKLFDEYGITHFLPTTEYEISLWNERRDYFEKRGIKLLINNRKIIEICTSKYKTAEFLKEAGIDTPETYYAESYKGGLSYPFIIKSDSGCGSKKLKTIHDEKEWEECEKSGMICQELVGDADNEYTVGVFSDGSVINSITLKRQLGYGGLSVFVEVCDIPGIGELAAKAAKAFDLKGCFNIQLRKQGEKYYVFEINPRLSSTTGFRHKFGFTDAVWWVDSSDGIPVPGYINNAEGMIGVKVMDDVVLGRQG